MLRQHFFTELKSQQKGIKVFSWSQFIQGFIKFVAFKSDRFVYTNLRPRLCLCLTVKDLDGLTLYRMEEVLCFLRLARPLSWASVCLSDCALFIFKY